MKLPADPAGKTARAICDTTDAVALGLACRCTARYETPRKRKIAIAPRIASVAAAFLPCGRRHAVTPFAIASTPVSAVDPDENERRSTNTVSVPGPRSRATATTARWP